MTSKAVADGHEIVVAVDPDWLRAPGRQFPVVVDPTATLVATKDGIVTSGCPDCTYSNDGLVSVGTSSTEAKRGLVAFDTSSIPVGSTLSYALMNMKWGACVTTSPGPDPCAVNDHQINAHQVTGAWSETGSDAPTWNWLTTHYNPALETWALRPAGQPYGSDHWWDLKALAQKWVTGVVPNYGIMLKLNNEALGLGGPCYWSRTSPYPPALYVDYTLPAGPPGDPSSGPLGLEDFYPYKDFDLGQGTAFANMATGNLIVQDTDFSVPGQGLNLRLTRTYNSQADSAPGPFGNGWRLGVADGQGDGNLLSSLGALNVGGVINVLLGNTTLDFTDADGTVHKFSRPGLDGWKSPPGVNLTLQDWGVGYLLTRPDRVYYYLYPGGPGGSLQLASMADAVGNYLLFAYYPDGKLNTVTDTVGRTFTISYNSNVISNIRFAGPAGTLDTTYGYDVGGRLASVTKSAGTPDAITTRYEYANGAISKVIDARGNSTQFGIASGRINQLTDRAGKAWNFAYTGGTCSPQSPATAAACLSNPETHNSVWSTNAAGNLLSRRDEGDVNSSGGARTNTTNFVWQNNRLQSQTDPAGSSMVYTYDPLGQIASTVASGGGDPSLTSTFTYIYPWAAAGVPGWSNMTQATLGDRTWNFINDPNTGTLTRVTDPLTKPTDFTYYTRGLVKTVKDANSKTTTYGDTALAEGGYDASGQPNKIIDPLGKAASFSYDFLGRQIQRTDRNGKLWRTGFDLRGNLIRSEDPLAHVTTYCYDQNDNQTLVIPPRGTSRVCSLDGTDGFSTATTYDSRDLVSSTLTTSDGKIRKSSYAYFDDGELKEILEPRSFDPTTGTQLATLQKAGYLRYPDNRISAFINEEGKQTDVLYTPHGLTEKVTDPAGDAGRHTVTYTYNRLGQVKSAQESGHGAAMRYEYNLHGDMTKQTTPKNTVTLVNPDAMGRPLTVTDANGKVTTRNYDNVGNLKMLKQPTGSGAFTTTNYFYTDRNEIDYETDPGDAAHVIDYEYDNEGRQTFRSDRYNGITGAIERTMQQVFNDDGTLSDRKATGTALSEHRSVFGYDADGNTTSVNTYKDGSATPNISAVTANYTSGGELKDWSEAIYPPTGAAVTKTGSYSWGQDGLQDSNTADSQTSTSTWFKDGNEKTFTPYGGFGSFTSTYFGNGAVDQMVFPNSAKLAQRYNIADLATSRVLTNSSGTKLSAWESIGYDENNNRNTETVTQTQPTGATPTVRTGTGTYGYDNLDRLTSFKHPFETSTATYGLDDAGNVTSEPGMTFSFTNNRLTGRSPSLPDLPFSNGYDHFGNQIAETKLASNPTTTTYNAASFTKRVTAPDGTWVEYSYDGLERTVSRQDSAGAVALFFHDGMNDQIAVETNATGTVTTRYLVDGFGVARGKLDIGNSTGRTYYMTDPRGNVTQIIGYTDQAVKAVFAYDPYGKDKTALSKKIASSNWDSRLKFQMAPRDPTTGSYNIGSRLMNPTINRFVGADMYVASGASLDLQMDPLTGNRYLYAGSNPAGLIDDGHHPSQCPKDGQCATFSFQKKPGQGEIRIGLFIHTATAGGFLVKGNNRGWDPNTNPANNKVYIDLHLAEGTGFVSATHSCWTWGKCVSARPWSLNGGQKSNNRLFVSTTKDGTLTVQVKARISLAPGPAIDATFKVDANGGVSYLRDDYPSLEVYKVRGGLKTTVFRDPAGPFRSLNLLRNSAYR
jgi:RHS repeat-associated protein